jgi:hypothetical protein
MPGKKSKGSVVDDLYKSDRQAVKEVYGNVGPQDIINSLRGQKGNVSARRSMLERARARRDARDGISNVRTRVPREMDDEVLMNAGGYMGGSSMSGRGTMAGELGRKGSMSVREAGEDMNELSKRRRGMETGGGVKIGKPIKGTIGKPQKLYKEKKKKNK